MFRLKYKKDNVVFPNFFIVFENLKCRCGSSWLLLMTRTCGIGEAPGAPLCRRDPTRGRSDNGGRPGRLLDGRESAGTVCVHMSAGAERRCWQEPSPADSLRRLPLACSGSKCQICTCSWPIRRAFCKRTSLPTTRKIWAFS